MRLQGRKVQRLVTAHEADVVIVTILKRFPKFSSRNAFATIEHVCRGTARVTLLPPYLLAVAGAVIPPPPNRASVEPGGGKRGE
jgi:hypothetical protein